MNEVVGFSMKCPLCKAHSIIDIDTARELELTTDSKIPRMLMCPECKVHYERIKKDHRYLRYIRKKPGRSNKNLERLQTVEEFLKEDINSTYLDKLAEFWEEIEF